MLSNQEFDNWCFQLNLPETARKLAAQIRSSEPVRRVGGGKNNVSGTYASLKMGKTIQFESHKVELPAIEQYEEDEDVLEYYDQPIRFSLSFKSASGRSVTCKHVPDFFVIRRASIGFEEWKPAKKLKQLAQEQPNHYCQASDGQWHNPPAEDYACANGVYYRLRLDTEINWIRYRNRQFLKNYFDKSYLISDEVKSILLSVITSNPGITLAQVLQSTPSALADDINALIATEQVYVDQSAVSLTESAKVQLFRDLETAEAHSLMIPWQIASSLRASDLTVDSSLRWDGKLVSVVQIGETKVVLRGESGLIQLTQPEFNHLVQQQEIVSIKNQFPSGNNSEAWERFFRASPEDFRVANYRYRVIEPYLQGEPPEQEAVPERTIRLWKSQFRAAQQIYNCGYIGLLQNRIAKGNRVARISSEAWEFIDKVIEEHYETLKQRGKLAVYGVLIREWEKANRPDSCPSHMTFYRRLKQRSGYEQTKKRQGTRAAYQKSPFYWEMGLTTPHHGDRPFEVCHIDHTELDIELVCSRTGRSLGRPWATILLDAFSRRILVAYLTFDQPSYRSCMTALRICVQRFERFPETIVVDNGAEFNSTYFETLLAVFRCTKKQRPAAQPRFGSIVERFFGTTHTEFFYNLKGNTQITKQIRQVTRTNNPKVQAVWSLGDLYESFCGYVYEIYDQTDHPALGQSPREAFVASLAQSGSRLQQRVLHDQTFQVLTLPSTPKGTAKVQPGRGVRINYLDYWSVNDCFLNPEVEGTQVPVRYDPFDMGTAYAYVKGNWVRCISEHHQSFQGRSEQEVKLASTQLRKQRQQHTQGFPRRAKAVATYLESVEAIEALQLQRLQDLAAEDIRQQLQGYQKSQLDTSSNIASKVKTMDSSDLSNNSPQKSQRAIVNIDPSTIQSYSSKELWK